MDWLPFAGAIVLTWLVLVFLFTPRSNDPLSRRTSVHADDCRYTRRPLWEKIVGPFVWILERQQ